MSNIPADLRYTSDHEWIKLSEDGTATIGITDHAQESLGDITFVDLPDTGDSFAKGESFGAVESVKAASDLYMPVGGEVIETNEALDTEPESVNNDAYAAGWMVRIKLTDPAETAELLEAPAYEAIL